MDNLSKDFMTPRLYAIASKAEKGCTVVDIGTDHAYIPVFLVASGTAHSAIAADVSRGPLCRADENIKRFGLENKIKTVLSDGFLGVKDNFDTAVIAGMGGLLICDILKAAPRGKKYILQPMRALPQLKKFLFENGFVITDECLAQEDNKLYNIIVAQDGNESFHEIDLYVGKHLLSDPLFPLYKKRLMQKLRKVICGLQSAKNIDLAQLEYYTNLLLQLEEKNEH